MRLPVFIFVAVLFVIYSTLAFSTSSSNHRDGAIVGIYLGESNDELYYTCTGFFISQNEILTAAHCISGKDFFGIVNRADNQKFNIVGVTGDSQNADIVRLAIDGGPAKLSDVLTVSTDEINVGNRITILSWMIPEVRTGMITSKFGSPVYPGASISTDIQTEPGVSGAPLLDDQRRIIGIHVSASNQLKVTTALLSSNFPKKKNQVVSLEDWILNKSQDKENLLWTIAAKIYDNDKCDDKILSTLQQLVTNNPNFSEAWFLKGRCEYLRKQFSFAETSFLISNKLRPHPMNYYGLVKVYVETDRFRKSVELLKQAVAMDPTEPAYHGTLIGYYLIIKYYKEASSAAQTFVQACPNFAKSQRQELFSQWKKLDEKWANTEGKKILGL